MAFSDVFSLVCTLVLCTGFFLGSVLLFRKITSGIESFKTNLKQKGLDVSSSGVSVKTDRRYDHEAYVDATQRNLLKAASAASYGPASSPKSSPVLGSKRSGSLKGSDESDETEEGKKRRFFRRSGR